MTKFGKSNKLTKLLILFGVVLIVKAQVLEYYTRDKCSRQCPCFYSSLFCKGYGRDSLPSDISADVENIDFQVRCNFQRLNIGALCVFS